MIPGNTTSTTTTYYLVLTYLSHFSKVVPRPVSVSDSDSVSVSVILICIVDLYLLYRDKMLRFLSSLQFSSPLLSSCILFLLC